MEIWQSPEDESLEVSSLQSTFYRVNQHHLQYGFAQESNSCFSPNEASAVLKAKEPMCCPMLSVYLFGEGSFHHLKGTPNVLYFEDMPDLSWQCLLFTSGEKRHIASSYNQGRMAISQTPENESLETSCLQSIFNSVNRLQPQRVFARQSNPCHFPT